MDNTKKSNLEGLKAHAQNKKYTTMKKVDAAIHNLIKAKERINFNSVSMESGVSKAYLYKNQELRNRIETLRRQQEGLPSPILRFKALEIRKPMRLTICMRLSSAE